MTDRTVSDQWVRPVAAHMRHICRGATHAADQPLLMVVDSRELSGQSSLVPPKIGPFWQLMNVSGHSPRLLRRISAFFSAFQDILRGACGECGRKVSRAGAIYHAENLSFGPIDRIFRLARYPP